MMRKLQMTCSLNSRSVHPAKFFWTSRASELLQRQLAEAQRESETRINRWQTELKSDLQRSQTELKSDLQRSQNELKEEFQRSHNELKEEFQRSRTEFSKSLTELKGELQQSRTELKGELQQSRTESKSDFFKLQDINNYKLIGLFCGAFVVMMAFFDGIGGIIVFPWKKVKTTSE